ncbi:MAG: PEGA domain-containing protein, partial [Vicinamibacteraceae bacterium]|nr:PEGA domain-containing protein [Vicinamibacteraceae bacterium]
ARPGYVPPWRRGINDPPIIESVEAPAPEPIAAALDDLSPSVYSGLGPARQDAAPSAAAEAAAAPAVPAGEVREPERATDTPRYGFIEPPTRMLPAHVPDDASGAADHLRESDGDDRRPASAVLLPFRLRPRALVERVDWKRTAAASILVILIEGVAFATAYWYVKPSDNGYLAIDTSYAGVEVLIDGQARGTTPFGQELEPGRYTIELRGRGHKKLLPVEIAPGVSTTQTVKWPRPPRIGSLTVTSTPTGARVTVDGEERGATPLTLDGLSAGRHAVLVESASGSVRSSVYVTEGEPVTLDVPIFSGWLLVYAPFEVRVFGEGRLLGTSNEGKMLLSPGSHTIELVNRRLGYRETRSIVIEPGKPATVSVAPEGSVEIEAPDGTEVFVDGEPAGTTPLAQVSVGLGTRDITLRHPTQGERRTTVVVTASAATRVNFSALP